MRTDGVHPPVKSETSRFPCKELPHMPGSLTTPERWGARAIAPARVAFRVIKHVGLRIEDFSRLNGWPVHSPVNASPPPSKVSSHDSGASVVRYTFTARDFHSLLFAVSPAPVITRQWNDDPFRMNDSDTNKEEQLRNRFRSCRAPTGDNLVR